ncbi:MAG TPA: MBOAT family O-acyltransferase [Patescibacteria group bacterium]|nr:MBOAT family O-acyltransferase [Patescibacteria group bacterium]
MLFNSFHFLLFFIVVTTAYFALPQRFRWAWLLLASCYFYMAFVPVYILILGFTIIIDYFAGIWIEKAEGKKRKSLLILSLVSNIAILAVFKYYNFLNGNLSYVLNGFGYQNHIPELSILLPIGLSFHTFQAMSYTIEVYRGHQSAERHFGIYALYVMFYPQLVAGPIERPQNLLHQFYERHEFRYERVVSGLQLMMWGLFKKVVIADRLAIVVDQVFKNPQEFGGPELLIATIFFTFQIYCDFSGYSDMAIGAARVMGFDLMKNFRRPYFSQSINEFWTRWHISLSTWFKDYLYIPLGGNRVSVPHWYLNLLAVFLVSGLWHGANWTFIIWGALHGFYLIFGLMTKALREKTWQLLKIPNFVQSFLKTVTTFALVAYAWIFFRAQTVGDALFISQNLFKGTGEYFLKKLSGGDIMPLAIDFQTSDWLLAFGAIMFMEAVHFIQRRRSIPQLLQSQPTALRWAVYYAVIVVIFFFGKFASREFIYFQF